MSLSGGQVTYNIASGQSTTWGHFGKSVQVCFGPDGALYGTGHYSSGALFSVTLAGVETKLTT